MTQPAVNSQRIGVLGGTFDPIHIGHLVTGANVRHELGLDRVLFVIAHDPWQKADRDVTPSDLRLAMVEAAVDGHPGLEASAVEIERGGTSYTADTLATLRDQAPDAELFLIIGQDQAANLHTWERVAEIRALSTLVVVRRPGSVGGLSDSRAIEVDVPLLEVSSSDVRARFCDGRPVDWLVPEPVVRFVRERGLYRSSR
ncbi:MAG TPA: nicotinate-nucleotide adenylyltransferase [Acidimicrobiales bacterium]|nr:nicotinate-nucleotide adenylyltransferase [Acidimicrobiales bacterium]